MSTSGLPSNAFPSISILTFLIPLSLQSLLLHPIFPSTISLPLRFLLIPFTIYYGSTAPFLHGFEPRQSSGGVNFVLGVMSMYVVWKGIEFGLVRDLTPYTWIGFEEDYKQKENGVKFGSKEHLMEIRKKEAERDSPVEIIVWTIHLLLSMRGNGWAFGPSSSSIAASPSSPPLFLLFTLFSILWSHTLLLFLSIIIVSRPSSRIATLATFFPSLSLSTLSSLSTITAGLSLGLAAFAGLTLGFQIALLPVFLLQTTLHSLLPSQIPPFDPRQYPPLFKSPWKPTSVTRFWNTQWHAFFTRPFKVLAFGPLFRLGKMGGVPLGKAMGTMGVFAMSAALHEHGIASSAYGAHPLSLTFTERWGATFYFLAQGLAIILENTFTSLTGRRVSGPLGFIWTSFWTGYLGVYLYICWTKMGLTNGLPEADHWTWERFVVPLGCLFPPPVWTDIPRIS